MCTIKPRSYIVYHICLCIHSQTNPCPLGTMVQIEEKKGAQPSQIILQNYFWQFYNGFHLWHWLTISDICIIHCICCCCCLTIHNSSPLSSQFRLEQTRHDIHDIRWVTSKYAHRTVGARTHAQPINIASVPSDYTMHSSREKMCFFWSKWLTFYLLLPQLQHSAVC